MHSGENVIFGLGDKKRDEPHRMHKHKTKFTHDHSSLKEDKQIFNREHRRTTKQKIKKGEEPEKPSKSSVKWSYW